MFDLPSMPEFDRSVKRKMRKKMPESVTHSTGDLNGINNGLRRHDLSGLAAVKMLGQVVSGA